MDFLSGYKYLIATPIPDIDYKMIKFNMVIEEDKPVKEERPFLGITDVRAIGPSSLLIKWSVTPGKSVDGFEVYVDGKLKSRVFNASRNTCVVDAVIKQNPFICVFAKSGRERFFPPATTTFRFEENS